MRFFAPQGQHVAPMGVKFGMEEGPVMLQQMVRARNLRVKDFVELYRCYKMAQKFWAKGSPAGRLYSTFWSNLSTNFSFWGPTLCRCTDGGELCHGPVLLSKFHPHRCNVSPLRGEKPQNRPPSKLNTGGLRCAQCCR